MLKEMRKDPTAPRRTNYDQLECEYTVRVDGLEGEERVGQREGHEGDGLSRQFVSSKY